MNKETIIRESHNIGMHDDGYFHHECPQCVEAAFSEYESECLEILHGMGKDDRAIELSQWLRQFDPLVMNEDLMGSYLGVGGDKLGMELEADPEFQRLEGVARPIRLRRLAKSQTRSISQ